MVRTPTLILRAVRQESNDASTGQLVAKTKFACERLTVLHIGPRADVSVSVDGQDARSVEIDELGEEVRAISIKVDASALKVGDGGGAQDGWELRVGVEAA